MAAPTVYEDVIGDLALQGVGQLFAGKKFWVAQRVPIRNRLLDDIKANGGEVVLFEKKADYMIADHFRRDCPPGSISYEFIEKSIKAGQLLDPERHLAGPPLGEAREAGALHRPTKGGRAAYTPEEDRILYKWVRDCEAAGLAVSGNEIYKQLEAKYPRHTWQSWRDHYVKHLCNRPPSAFNIPDNAPPSPLSDKAAPRAEPTNTAPRQANRAASAQRKTPAPRKVSGKTIVSPPDYTLDQLAATFTSDDWEELYAFVEVIDALEGKKSYYKAWEQWARSQDNQTVDQWRQYFEKVVRPQWKRDPEWKREQIRKKVEERHQSASTQDTQEAEGKAEVIESAPAIDETNVAAQEATEVDDAQDTQKHSQAEASKLTSDVKLMSSSTAQHESPRYISSLHQNVLKRMRRDNMPEDHEERDVSEQPRPIKRQRSSSPAVIIGTHKEPVEIFSSESSDSQENAEEEQINDQIRDDIERTQQEKEIMMDSDLDEADQKVESVESEDFVGIGRLPPPLESLEEPSDDDLPANTPTPRATRQQKLNNFDTQAILSSPSQAIAITRLPRPVGLTQHLYPQTEDRSSSLAPHPESDASTTQSLQEFRRSLNNEDATQPSYPILPSLPRPLSLSPTPSDSSASTASGDPDVPLSASEMDAFFAEQNDQGFSDDYIAAALKRTRCRPGLAELVLEAWGNGQTLPVQRGIWSLEDDEAVESGDGFALAKLERVHTLDGWGGITERLRFLEGYRSR
jgi:hypothetical protein